MRKLGLLLFIFVASKVMGATPSGIEIRRGGQTSTNPPSPGLYLTTDGTNSYWATVSASSTNVPSYALTNSETKLVTFSGSGSVTHNGVVTNKNDTAFESNVRIYGGAGSKLLVSGQAQVQHLTVTNTTLMGDWLTVLGNLTNTSFYYTGVTPSRALVVNASGLVTVPTGSPDGTKFLRDDNTYAVPPGGGGASGTNYAGIIITNFIRSVVLDFSNLTNPSLPVLTSNRFVWAPSNNPAVLSVSGSFISGQEQSIEGTIILTNANITSVTLPYGGPNGEIIALGNVPSTNNITIKWDGARAFIKEAPALPGWGFTAYNGILYTTNNPFYIPTNVTSAIIDYSDTSNKQIYNVSNHLVSSLAICPSNLVVGRTLAVYFDTNLLTYDVSVTNVAGNQIRWNFNIPTNGSTSFTKTNTLRAKLFLTVEKDNIITADMGYYR